MISISHWGMFEMPNSYWESLNRENEERAWRNPWGNYIIWRYRD